LMWSHGANSTIPRLLDCISCLRGTPACRQSVGQIVPIVSKWVLHVVCIHVAWVRMRKGKKMCQHKEEEEVFRCYSHPSRHWPWPQAFRELRGRRKGQEVMQGLEWTQRRRSTSSSHSHQTREDRGGFCRMRCSSSLSASEKAALQCPRDGTFDLSCTAFAILQKVSALSCKHEYKQPEVLFDVMVKARVNTAVH
jgi:hypothetical protein